MHRKRTDLAVEAHALYSESTHSTHIPGVEVYTKKHGDVAVTHVEINSSSGASALGKPEGNYITLEIPSVVGSTKEDFTGIVKVFATELHALTGLKPNATVLVVGLGNRQITADALGPKVVDGLLVTRHLFELMPEDIDDGLAPLCALAPGVLGLTGIETNEIIKGVSERVKPDLIIAIDALASRSLERVMTTIQLTDTGITPGAGVGNVRGGLNNQTLGVPVIAVGVPTVVDAATMANDTIDMLLDSLMQQTEGKGGFYNMLANIDRNEKYGLIDEVLQKSFTNLVVTPKDVDEIIDDMSELIANGINICVHQGMTIDDMNKYS